MKRFLAAPIAAMALTCTVLLGGCGGPAPEELIRTDLTEAFDEISPENEELIASIEEGAGDSFELLNVSSEDFAKKYFGDFEYEIGDIEVDSEKGIASAEVTVSMKSLTDIMTKFSEDYQTWIEGIDPNAVPSEEELYAKGGELLMAAIDESDVEESEIIIDFNKNDDGEWEPDEDAATAIMDAMF